MDNAINERITTPIKYECDVCVCGGGVAVAGHKLFVFCHNAL